MPLDLLSAECNHFGPEDDELTLCGLVTPYADIGLSQRRLV